MKSFANLFKDISAHLSKGRLNHVAQGTLEVIKGLESRIAAIEERNRAKDCICTKTDDNGDFEIVKRLKESEERRVFSVDVGNLSSDQVKAHLEKVKAEVILDATKRKTAAKKPAVKKTAKKA